MKKAFYTTPVTNVMEVEPLGTSYQVPTAWTRATATTWECKMTSSTENSVATRISGTSKPQRTLI